MKQILGSRKGATMVEAAIFYPILLLAVMFVIYLCINMYSMTALQSHTHLTVRKAAAEAEGKATVEIDDGGGWDRYRKRAEAKGISLSEGKRFGASYLEAFSEEGYEAGRLTAGRRTKASFHGRAYRIDGTLQARLRDLL